MTRDQDTNHSTRQSSSVINYNRKPTPNLGKRTGTSTRRPRSSGNCSEAVGTAAETDENAKKWSSSSGYVSRDRPGGSRPPSNHDNIALDDLGASALPSVKKAASGLDPPPTILATGQNNNRKKLQLQFSFQEKSVSDDEENDDEIVFHDNPYAGPSTSLLSDDEEDVTTSPSLTFGVEQPRVSSTSSRGRKGDYRALQRNNSRSNDPDGENSVGLPEIVGGTKKKSYSRSDRSGQDRSGCPDRRKRSRKASDTALAVVAAGIGRVENGEIRPLRKVSNREEDEDENEENDNRKNSNIEENGRGDRGHTNSNGNGNDHNRKRSDRRKRSDNHNKVMAPPSNGGTEIPPGMVGGISLKANIEKDADMHIIPESKKFPQVSRFLDFS
jgi:hypothetical protein